MTAVLVAFGLSALLCGLYLRLARQRRLLAVPNERSSHDRPTPHGGGLPLLLGFCGGLAWAASVDGGAWERPYLLITAVALALLAIGVLDDLRGLSLRLRLALYAAACLALSLALLGTPLAGHPLALGLLALPVALALLWVLNLYNFMDGIDGIAALQTLLACTGAALLTADAQYAAYCLLLAAAHAGFLLWNRPPARLFMGDAGSVPTGLILGALALLGAVGGQLDPLCWLVLLAAFITDATWTLLWRAATGQPFLRAHRLHAYQRLSRHWRSHGSVDLLLLGIGLLWLYPLAFCVHKWPEYGLLLVILAYLPLVAGMGLAARIE